VDLLLLQTEGKEESLQAFFSIRNLVPMAREEGSPSACFHLTGRISVTHFVSRKRDEDLGIVQGIGTHISCRKKGEDILRRGRVRATRVYPRTRRKTLPFASRGTGARFFVAEGGRCANVGFESRNVLLNWHGGGKGGDALSDIGKRGLSYDSEKRPA